MSVNINSRDRYGKVLGIVGGGQLGKMMAYRASLLGFYVKIYGDSDDCCAFAFANKSIVGEYTDQGKIIEFCNSCDFITTEFESINPLALFKSKFADKSNAMGIYVSQNRLREKTLAKNLGILTPEFSAMNNHADVRSFFREHGPCIIKTTTMGYDGKGQFLIETIDDVNKIPIEIFEQKPKPLQDEAFSTLLHKNDLAYSHEAPLIAESLVDYKLEFSVICTRFANGEIVFFPIPINTHKNGILYKSEVKNDQKINIVQDFDNRLALLYKCEKFKSMEILLQKYQHDFDVKKLSLDFKNGHLFDKAEKFESIDNLYKKYPSKFPQTFGLWFTQKIANKLNFVGTMAVEFFLTKDNKVVFNEIAPRPHNSGHYTMDLCNICQFESHVRAVCGLDRIDPVLLHEGYMQNLIGDETFNLVDEYMDNKNATIHLYCKKVLPGQNLDGRKLGHINVRKDNLVGK